MNPEFALLNRLNCQPQVSRNNKFKSAELTSFESADLKNLFRPIRSIQGF